MKKITIVLILFAIMLTACQSSGAKAKGEYTEIPSASKIEVGDAIIVYQRSGGFAGVDEQWSLYADGRISDNKGNQKVVEGAQITALIDELKTAGVLEMKDSMGSGISNACKDCFTYTITVNIDGKTKKIITQDNTKGVPEAFWNVIKKLNNLVTENQ